MTTLPACVARHFPVFHRELRGHGFIPSSALWWWFFISLLSLSSQPFSLASPAYIPTPSSCAPPPDPTNPTRFSSSSVPVPVPLAANLRVFSRRLHLLRLL
ncbi:hypothetical protein B0H13DRAFT_2349935 [Mycena leptocephala]|nr:hypothetical protein B0H13DRAFT_2349935 [Mycena leptocephala]